MAQKSCSTRSDQEIHTKRRKEATWHPWYALFLRLEPSYGDLKPDAQQVGGLSRRDRLDVYKPRRLAPLGHQIGEISK